MGSWMTGAYIAPLNCAYKGAEFEHQLKLANPKVLVVHPDTLDVALSYAHQFNLTVLSMVRDPQQRVPCWLDWETSAECPVSLVPQADTRTTLATLFFSSGTTGISNPSAPTVQQAPPETVVTLGVMPFYHAGLGTMVVFRKYSMPLVCQAIQDFKITAFSAVPPMLLQLLNFPRVKDYDLSSINNINVGAAPISENTIQKVQDRYDCQFAQGYGMTECGPMMTATPAGKSKGSSIGKPIHNLHLRVVSAEGKDLGPNQPGELWARGPQMMMGYIDNPQATAEMIDKDGYIHTGDIGYYDEEGYFFIVDRIKELIKTKGLQVAPAELEAVLLSCPLVEDAGVIGVYDEAQSTEFPMAFVVPIDKAQPDENLAEQIHQWVDDRVARHKRLKGGIILTDTIPKSPTGKILRNEMKKKYNRLRLPNLERAKL
ncbi:acetyl-CoA synthetase-like protein [Hesseltinella vesiculosa]|uniref:Acetyl-CoA synthetase-like protein n=1 Tax=Hesseltinella vesiculosa TaxID=101127 RepID=A0A1X2GQK7_9FUNG|nr:acetyl-CoA synthetase-like protein [Hesseltinella vesiculosa]